MTFQPETLAQKITDEILRVSFKRERELRAAKVNNAMGRVRPRLYLMDQAMHFAKAAREERCPVAMLMWLSALEGFRE